MNRSFRAQDSQMQMQAAVVRQRQQLRAKMMKEKEEELALFLEMKKREKEQNNLFLINNTEDFVAPFGINFFFFCGFDLVKMFIWFKFLINLMFWMLLPPLKKKKLQDQDMELLRYLIFLQRQRGKQELMIFSIPRMINMTMTGR